MTLDVGDVFHINEPSADDVRQHLRNLPMEAPFMILSIDERRFFQTRPYGGGYRVEWRDEADFRQALVTFERAEQLLAAYSRGDEPAVRGGAAWRELRWYNDPYYGLVAAAALCAAILVLVFAAEVWHMIR
jgi:hypothetical protein